MNNKYNFKWMQKYFLPFWQIKKSWDSFIIWLIIAVGVGSLGFSFVLIYNFFVGISLTVTYDQIIMSGSIPSFLIILTAQGLIGCFEHKNTLGNNEFALKLRKTIMVVAIATIIGLTICYILFLTSGDKIIETGQTIALIFYLLSFIVSIYLFCFKYSDWELKAEEYLIQSEQDINEVLEHSKSIKHDKNGVEL